LARSSANSSWRATRTWTRSTGTWWPRAGAGLADLISRIFRAIHTIKGTSGFLAFSRLEKLAHAGESLLSELRDGVQPVTPTTITTLLATIDGVRSILSSIEDDAGRGRRRHRPASSRRSSHS
jgi:chemotaxis protein histidine kinase CheA